MARADEKPEGADGVLTQVCVECGQEYYYDADRPPRDMVCGRCGNRVFRSYFDVTGDDEVERDFQDNTARDLTTEDPGTDVTPGDLEDLNNP